MRETIFKKEGERIGVKMMRIQTKTSLSHQTPMMIIIKNCW
jgi:hypothetical protein